jgi:hypothetical protein
MRKIIEYTLVSADGAFEDPHNWLRRRARWAAAPWA